MSGFSFAGSSGNSAPLASPAFTGNPTAPTPAALDNDTSIATTAWVTERTLIESTFVRSGVASLNLTVPGASITAITTNAFVADRDYYLPITVVSPLVALAGLYLDVSVASGTGGSVVRSAIYAADRSWQPTGTLIEAFATMPTDSTGVKTVATAGAAATLARGRYVLAINLSHGATMRTVRAAPMGGPLVLSTLGTTPFPSGLYASRAHAAFPSTPAPWTAIETNATHGIMTPLFCDITDID